MNAANRRHLNDAIEHGQVVFSRIDVDADLRKGLARREIQEGVRKDCVLEIVHTVKVEKVHPRLREEVEIFGPEPLIEKPPCGLVLRPQDEKEIRRANGNRRHSTERLRDRQGVRPTQLKSLAEFHRAVHGAHGISPNDNGRTPSARDDLERLGPRIERDARGLQSGLGLRVIGKENPDT